MKVTLYIDLPGVGSIDKSAVSLECKKDSFDLTVRSPSKLPFWTCLPCTLLHALESFGLKTFMTHLLTHLLFFGRACAKSQSHPVHVLLICIYAHVVAGARVARKRLPVAQDQPGARHCACRVQNHRQSRQSCRQVEERKGALGAC